MKESWKNVLTLMDHGFMLVSCGVGLFVGLVAALLLNDPLIFIIILIAGFSTGFTLCLFEEIKNVELGMKEINNQSILLKYFN
ncbi:hypothetical protein BH11BAC2_BH11BAC2_01850 [soil metagenome]